MVELFVPSSPERGTPETEAGPELTVNGPTRSTPEFSFTASTSQVAHLADVLSSLTAIHRHALMIISEEGIVFYNDYNHILNAQVTVDASLFSTFDFRCESLGTHDASPKSASLGIDVALLGDSFCAAASTASAGSGDVVSCYIRYSGDGHPLVVEFEDRLMSEQIEFLTLQLDIEYPYSGGFESETGVSSGAHSNGGFGPSELIIDHSALRFEVILHSDILTNLLLDLQNLLTEDLYLIVSNVRRARRSVDVALNNSNEVSFVSKGAIGYSKLMYPSSRTLLSKLEIYNGGQADSVSVKDCVLSLLAFSPFIKIYRAVKFSSKCKIMKDLNGVVSIQLLCKSSASKSYPGTLITFNMLEKSSLDSNGQTIDADLDDLFDDSTYEQVTEYNQVDLLSRAERLNKNTDNTGEPFTYASFKRTSAAKTAPNKKSRLDAHESDAQNIQSTSRSAGGNHDEPFFI